MHKISTLKNGLNLITIDLPYLDSITSLVAVGAGSRYETKDVNGLSHFLEHMFFKGSKKYPSAEKISSIIDGMGAVNNASTSKEYTYYWIKSSAKNLETSIDILSSMLKESLLEEEEIQREKGVIIEELRMIRDNPGHFVWDLYEKLQFGDQPLGWDIGGEEQIILNFKKNDFVKYLDSFYSPKNMALVFAGKIPPDIEDLANQYFLNLPLRASEKYLPYKKEKQQKPKIDIYFKQTDQAHLVLGVEGYDRNDPKRYAARLLGLVLGSGMSSRLFIQVRERRGLAYSVHAGHDVYIDTGSFTAYAGLKLEKLEEGLKVIKDELENTASAKISEDELQKVKDMERGRLALRTESTNFLAEYFGIKYILDREIQTFEDYLDKIDQVTTEDLLEVAKDLFQKNHYNLQLVAPIKDAEKLETILKS